MMETQSEIGCEFCGRNTEIGSSPRTYLVNSTPYELHPMCAQRIRKMKRVRIQKV